MISGDTIAAIATAPGRGGVAVVRVSGPEAFAIAGKVTSADCRPASPLSARHARFHDLSAAQRRIGGSGRVVDDGILLAFKGPRSYTGEDVVEFQCHGGTVTPRRVLAACLAAGARLARRGEFTERAFLNGKLDYDQAESVLDLIDAKSARAADAALEGLGGRRARDCRALYEQALDLSARVEHALDVDEGELPDGFCENLKSEISNLKSRISEALRRAHEGKILREGALVVLAGPPNAGKSSLLNALLEENRAIVSDTPGTTRDSIEAWLDLDGWPIRLTDTAGLRETGDALEGEGVKRAEDLIVRADLVLWLGASSRPSAVSSARLLTLHPKCDLGRGEGLNVSAKTGEGLGELRSAIVAKLEEKVAAADEGDVASADESVLHEARTELDRAEANRRAAGGGEDLVVLANAVRGVAERLGARIGATYSSDLLDNLFSRFCVGK